MPTDKLLAEWFWTDRWSGSKAFSLPMEARGIYREMLTQAWRLGAKLPNDHVRIRRIIGCTEREWKRWWTTLEEFWVVDGPDLVNVTQVVIYSEAKAARDAAQARAQAGGYARAQALLKQVPKQSVGGA